MPIEVRQPRTPAELDLYYDLRWRILRAPYTNSRSNGRDPQEEHAFHLTAWDGDQLVGAGRLHFNSPQEAQVRAMAVEPHHRSSGVGSLVLQALEHHARNHGATSVVLHAREDAVAFYRKNGYQVIEPSYNLFGQIPHWLMRKDL
jgi:ribosomal protein S18 acetylase RimI-like enzyme